MANAPSSAAGHGFCGPSPGARFDKKVLPGPEDDRERHQADHLLLKATRGFTIALVSSRERKRRQPGLATDDPAFVGGHQLVRGIERSQVHFDFVCGARENGRAAAGTEKPPGVLACFAIDRHRILREYRGSVKKRPMMLAAVETVTKADPVGESRRHNSDVAAEATAGESVHASPLKSTGRNGYNAQHCHCNLLTPGISSAGMIEFERGAALRVRSMPLLRVPERPPAHSTQPFVFQISACSFHVPAWFFHTTTYFPVNVVRSPLSVCT